MQYGAEPAHVTAPNIREKNKNYLRKNYFQSLFESELRWTDDLKASTAHLMENETIDRTVYRKIIVV